jgi:hypothetical protein
MEQVPCCDHSPRSIHLTNYEQQIATYSRLESTRYRCVSDAGHDTHGYNHGPDNLSLLERRLERTWRLVTPSFSSFSLLCRYLHYLSALSLFKSQRELPTVCGTYSTGKPRGGTRTTTTIYTAAPGRTLELKMA